MPLTALSLGNAARWPSHIAAQPVHSRHEFPGGCEAILAIEVRGITCSRWSPCSRDTLDPLPEFAGVVDQHTMNWASEKKGFAFAFGAGVRWQLGSRPRVVAGSIRLADSGVLGENPDDVPVRPSSQFS